MNIYRCSWEDCRPIAFRGDGELYVRYSSPRFVHLTSINGKSSPFELDIHAEIEGTGYFFQTPSPLADGQRRGTRIEQGRLE